jgi:glucokinase
MVIVHNGAQCTCGRKGCWEAYSSATALIRMTAEKIAYCKENGIPTIMSSAERVSGRTACDAMRAGDKAAKEVYDDYLAYLATGITNIINIFQPEVISLGGGVSNEGQPLIDDLLPLINAEQYGGNEKANATKITIATLKNDAGIIGAAAL